MGMESIWQSVIKLGSIQDCWRVCVGAPGCKLSSLHCDRMQPWEQTQQHAWVCSSPLSIRQGHSSWYSFSGSAPCSLSRLAAFHAGQVSLTAVQSLLVRLYRDTCSGCSAQYHTNERSVQSLCRSHGMSHKPHTFRKGCRKVSERSQAGNEGLIRSDMCR